MWRKTCKHGQRLAKDAKAQAEHAHNEVNLNATCIEVVKKKKGAMLHRVEVINATIVEEARRKDSALHVHIIG
jgi:hypothetical protein